MPTLGDVLYKVPDLASSHWWTPATPLQYKINNTSSRLTTFWMPQGQMRWLKLPFGISVVLAIYQCKQHKLLSGLADI